MSHTPLTDEDLKEIADELEKGTLTVMLAGVMDLLMRQPPAHELAAALNKYAAIWFMAHPLPNVTWVSEEELEAHRNEWTPDRRYEILALSSPRYMDDVSHKRNRVTIEALFEKAFKDLHMYLGAGARWYALVPQLYIRREAYMLEVSCHTKGRRDLPPPGDDAVDG